MQISRIKAKAPVMYCQPFVEACPDPPGGDGGGGGGLKDLIASKS